MPDVTFRKNNLASIVTSLAAENQRLSQQVLVQHDRRRQWRPDQYVQNIPAINLKESTGTVWSVVNTSQRRKQQEILYCENVSCVRARSGEIFIHKTGYSKAMSANLLTHTVTAASQIDDQHYEHLIQICPDTEKLSTTVNRWNQTDPTVESRGVNTKLRTKQRKPDQPTPVGQYRRTIRQKIMVDEM